MARIHADRPDHSRDPVYDANPNQSIENQSTESKKMHRWPAEVICATYKYLSEGVRTLGEAYSTYDDRDVQ
jgi:hypothetical protein